MEFTTAVERTEKPAEEPIILKIDGEEYKCFDPSPTQIALLMASYGRYNDQADQIAGVIDFFVGILDKDSHRRLVRRLLDRDDPFGLEQVTVIMQKLLEKWSGRPFELPSVSTQ